MDRADGARDTRHDRHPRSDGHSSGGVTASMASQTHGRQARNSKPHNRSSSVFLGVYALSRPGTSQSSTRTRKASDASSSQSSSTSGASSSFDPRQLVAGSRTVSPDQHGLLREGHVKRKRSVEELQHSRKHPHSDVGHPTASTSEQGLAADPVERLEARPRQTSTRPDLKGKGRQTQSFVQVEVEAPRASSRRSASLAPGPAHEAAPSTSTRLQSQPPLKSVALTTKSTAAFPLAVPTRKTSPYFDRKKSRDVQSPSRDSTRNEPALAKSTSSSNTSERSNELPVPPQQSTTVGEENAVASLLDLSSKSTEARIDVPPPIPQASSEEMEVDFASSSQETPQDSTSADTSASTSLATSLEESETARPSDAIEAAEDTLMGGEVEMEREQDIPTLQDDAVKKQQKDVLEEDTYCAKGPSPELPEPAPSSTSLRRKQAKQASSISELAASKEPGSKAKTASQVPKVRPKRRLCARMAVETDDEYQDEVSSASEPEASLQVPRKSGVIIDITSDESDHTSKPSNMQTSPLTPLASSQTSATSGEKTATPIKSLRFEEAPRVRSLSIASSNRHQSPRKRSLSDCSDEDFNVPLRQLPAQRLTAVQAHLLREGSLIPSSRTTRRSPSKVNTQRRPAKSALRATSRQPSVVRERSQPSQRAFYTRSRTNGSTADCLQCHRCETYQSRMKTFACMSCSLAVCGRCLWEHYANHPSYSLIRAFLSANEDSMQNSPSREGPTSSLHDLSLVDFRCPVCKHICRCANCLRGPFPKAIEAISHRAPLMQERQLSLASSDGDYDLEHSYPSLNAGTSSRPNLKVRLNPNRSGSEASLRPPRSNRQHLARSASSNAYYDMQEAIAGEAARRAQVDAETDYVPVVSARQPRRALDGSAEQDLFGDSTDTDDDWVEVSSQPMAKRPARSARVRIATTVGQHLGKSPAYEASRRSPRREGDQLIPYNDREPVLTLAPVEEEGTDDTLQFDEIPSHLDALDQVGAAEGPTTQQAGDPAAIETSNELLDSLLDLPDSCEAEEFEGMLDSHVPAFPGLDYFSPSDEATNGSTSSTSSIASPTAYDDLDDLYRTTLTSHAQDASSQNGASPFFFDLNSLGLDDGLHSSRSASSTAIAKRTFLQKSASPVSFKMNGTPRPSVPPALHDDAFPDSIHSSPSRHITFDFELASDMY